MTSSVRKPRSRSVSKGRGTSRTPSRRSTTKGAAKSKSRSHTMPKKVVFSHVKESNIAHHSEVLGRSGAGDDMNLARTLYAAGEEDGPMAFSPCLAEVGIKSQGLEVSSTSKDFALGFIYGSSALIVGYYLYLHFNLASAGEAFRLVSNDLDDMCSGLARAGGGVLGLAFDLTALFPRTFRLF